MLKRFIFLFFSFCHVFCFESYLKRCPEKLDSCHCSFVDYVYVINLDERPEKFERVKREFERYGVTPYRFSAVNGWKLSFEAIKSFGIDYQDGFQKGVKGTQYQRNQDGKMVPCDAMIDAPGRYLSHCMSRGALGIVMSHLSVIKDALDSGYKRVWILEDDVEILEDLKELESLLKEADRRYVKKWDVLYTDEDTINRFHKRIPCYAIADRPDVPMTNQEKAKRLRRKVVSKRLMKLGNRYGAYSFIINRSGMRKIMNFYENHGVFLPYDMEFIYIDNFLQLTSRRNIVSHKVGSSSDNGGPNYEKK